MSFHFPQEFPLISVGLLWWKALYSWLGLFEKWIAWFVLSKLIHSITIHPVDSVNPAFEQPGPGKHSQRALLISNGRKELWEAVGILQKPVGFVVTDLCVRTANKQIHVLWGRYRRSLEILRNSGSSTYTICSVGTLLKRDSELTCVWQRRILSQLQNVHTVRLAKMLTMCNDGYCNRPFWFFVGRQTQQITCTYRTCIKKFWNL